MNLTLISTIAVGMIVAGILFAYLIVRGSRSRRPNGALEWVAFGLSSALVVAAFMLLVTSISARNRSVGTNSEAAFLNSGNAVPELDPSELNRPAPDFNFRLVANDTETTLSDLKGKVVLLNVWATWCAPCRMEMPELNRLQETYRDEGLVVLTISDESREDLTAYNIEQSLLEYSGYLPDPTLFPEPFAQGLSVRPTSYFIDREGVLRSYLTGVGSFEMFERAILPYL